jgi:hypothetical protein
MLIDTYNQINQDLCILENRKKNSLTINEDENGKIDRYI